MGTERCDRAEYGEVYGMGIIIVAVARLTFLVGEPLGVDGRPRNADPNVSRCFRGELLLDLQLVLLPPD